MLACRRELVDYDRQQRQVVAATSSPVTSPREPPSLKAEEALSCRSKKEKAGYVTDILYSLKNGHIQIGCFIDSVTLVSALWNMAENL